MKTIYLASAALLAICCLGDVNASAAQIPVELTLTPGNGYDNWVAINVFHPDIGGDKQTVEVGGAYSVRLYANFDGAWNLGVTGLAFVQKPYVPGEMTFSPDMEFFGGLLTTTDLRGDLNTASPPGEVADDGGFATDGHTLWLNGGTLTALGEPTELSENPLELNLSSEMSGLLGSLWVSAPAIIGNQAHYDVELVLPVDFSDWPLPGVEGATISASGSIRAVGSFSQTIPEPGTLALLAAAGLVAFACCARRR